VPMLQGYHRGMDTVTFFIHRSEIYVVLSLHCIDALTVIATNVRARGVGFLLANFKEI
jgi:hypothetical protein